MKSAALWTLAFVGLCVITLWLRSKVHYRIGSRHVKITLFGIPIRRINLANIARVSKRQPRFAENWSNTLRPSHRTLTIIRNSGLRRHIVITPKNRYIFISDLQNAINRVTHQQTTLKIESDDDLKAG
jgi:hypothetical protein